MTEVKNKIKLTSYKEYLISLNNNELISILDTFKIKYKKNNKKDILISLITSNINQIGDTLLNYFQQDEYINMKYLIKKGGVVKVKIDYLMLSFLNNLNRNHIVIKLKDNEFMLPKELYNSLKKKIEDKSYDTIAKNNTKEYSLIQGVCLAYGAYNLKDFYKIYKELYSISEKEFEKRITDLKDFYKEFNIYNEGKNKNMYIASKEVTTLKTCKSLIKKNGKYKEFSANDLIKIYNFTYLDSYKSYKKLIKFISRNYYVGKGNFKIINKYILSPYLEANELDSKKANIMLNSLLEQYFEYNSKKHTERFAKLIEDVSLDFPSWKLLGYSKKEKENEN